MTTTIIIFPICKFRAPIQKKKPTTIIDPTITTIHSNAEEGWWLRGWGWRISLWSRMKAATRFEIHPTVLGRWIWCRARKEGRGNKWRYLVRWKKKEKVKEKEKIFFLICGLGRWFEKMKRSPDTSLSDSSGLDQNLLMLPVQIRIKLPHGLINGFFWIRFGYEG